jgi:hypothetical protein
MSGTPVPGDGPGRRIIRGPAPPARPRGGGARRTVAAIAGGLLGARWGASAAPLAWRRILHGWPGLRGRYLIALALCSAQNGQSGPDGWPRSRVFDCSAYGDTGVLAAHPHDRLVLLGGVDAARKPPDGVDAVVSLCRLGRAEVPAPGVASSRSRRGMARRQRGLRAQPQPGSGARPGRRRCRGTPR